MGQLYLYTTEILIWEGHAFALAVFFLLHKDLGTSQWTSCYRELTDALGVKVEISQEVQIRTLHMTMDKAVALMKDISLNILCYFKEYRTYMHTLQTQTTV